MTQQKIHDDQTVDTTNSTRPKDLVTFYLAFQGYERELESELSSKKIPVKSRWGRFFLSSQTQPQSIPIIWAQWSGCKGEIYSFSSVKEATLHLKQLPLKWVYWGIDSYRRGELISHALPLSNPTRYHFLPGKQSWPLEQSKLLGLFSLVGPQELLYFQNCQTPFPLGQFEFEENKSGPPSRAYLKLWEFFTRFPYLIPKKKDVCVDMGAAPGGWTWVLAQLSQHVYSVDKAPLILSPQLSSSVTFLKTSALALNPRDIPPIQWFFSDMICYPDKWKRLIMKWVNHYPQAHFVCTLKFQGETPYIFLQEVIKEMGGYFIHLYHNKNEVTWYRFAS
jgi:23S rRNA (cytidine2498-2'-O)-methyltransferase